MQRLFIIGMFGASASFVATAQEPTASTEEILELSPFVVESSSDIGYLATDTLAGTRLKTKLKEVGAAVSVYTPEFLQDIEATDLDEILTYTTGTESAGVRGNFSGLDSGGGNDEVRVNPSGVNRVRSLAAATRTRDYMPTFIPGDNYNISSITLSRGPNAVLAGIGGAGGVIDSSLRKANFKDATRFNFRTDEHGSHREEIHWNKSVIDDVFAIRLDAMYEHKRYRQDPAFEKDTRVFLAGQWNIRKADRDAFFGNTSLRANLEFGRIYGTPPTNLTPLASLDGWFEEGPFSANNPTRSLPKWYHSGYDKSYYDNSGNLVAKLSNPGRFGGSASPAPRGFPVYGQWALTFADPNSGTATVGITDPALSNLQGFQGTTRGGSGAFVGTGDLAREQNQYGRGRLSNPDIFDYYNKLLTGTLDSMEQDWQATDIRLEQLFMGGKAGIELGFSRQNNDRKRNLPIPANGENYIYIDVNTTLSIASPDYPAGVPNPNYGRPFVVTRDIFRQNEQFRESDVLQATGFISHDFTESDSSIARWLGRHTVSGLLFRSEYEQRIHGYSSTFSTDPQYVSNQQSTGAEPGLYASTANALWYLGDSALGLTDVNQLRLNPIAAQRPDPNEEYFVGVWNRTTSSFEYGLTKPAIVLTNINEQFETVTSKSLAIQSRWLDDHVITLFGWRDDESETETGLLPDRLPQGGYDANEVVYIPSASQGKESLTKSVVAIFPEEYLFELPFGADMRVYWNESGNFQPVGQRRNFYNEEIGSPEAETKEYGLMLSFFEGKLDVRINRFETRIQGQPVAVRNPSGYIFAMINRMTAAHQADLLSNSVIEDFHNGSAPLVNFSTFEDVARGFFDTMPQRLQDNMGADRNFNPRFEGTGSSFQFIDERVIDSTSVSDTVATGVEIEVVWNPNRNWRFALNASKNKAVQSDIAALELDFVDEWLSNLDTMFDGELKGFHRNPGSNDGSFLDQYRAEHVVPILNAAASSGTSNPEVREWRVNGLAFYKFTDGFAKGVTVGTAVRWEDEKAIGYPLVDTEVGRIADVTNPYFGPKELYIDLNFGYERKVQAFGRRANWRVNFVVKNVFGDDELIPVQALPDGTVNRLQIPAERTWILSTSLAF